VYRGHRSERRSRRMATATKHQLTATGALSRTWDNCSKVVAGSNKQKTQHYPVLASYSPCSTTIKLLLSVKAVIMPVPQCAASTMPSTTPALVELTSPRHIIVWETTFSANLLTGAKQAQVNCQLECWQLTWQFPTWWSPDLVHIQNQLPNSIITSYLDYYKL